MAKRFFALLVVIVISAPAWAQGQPIEYTLSFPAPEHCWMQVEARFANGFAASLQLRMARTSPGRYALHEFAKNVFDIAIVNGKGQPLTATRGPHPRRGERGLHEGAGPGRSIQRPDADHRDLLRLRARDDVGESSSRSGCERNHRRESWDEWVERGEKIEK